MKQCTKCKEVKSINNFARINRYKDGHNTQCKQCRKVIDARSYKKNKEHLRIKVQRNKGLLQAKVLEYLFDHPCVDCGEQNIIVLEFDHRDPTIKTTEISKLYSWDKIQKEIDKCDVVCTNCHKLRSAKRGNWYQNVHKYLSKESALKLKIMGRCGA